MIKQVRPYPSGRYTNPARTNNPQSLRDTSKAGRTCKKFGLKAKACQAGNHQARHLTERRKVWLIRLPWKQKIAGSNPAALTIIKQR